MSKLKQALTNNVMNEERALAMIKKELGLKTIKKKEPFWLKNIIIAFSLVSLVVFGSYYDRLGLGKALPIDAASIVSIDINPSFTLKVSEEGFVLEILTENADAQAIRVDDLISLDAATVVEALILRAQEAGYLLDPINSDYVVVTTAPAKEGNEALANQLNDFIQEILDREGISDDVNIALIKGTLQQWLDAQAQQKPLGLFILGSLINQDVQSVGNFVLNNEYLSLLQNVSTIIKRSTLNTKSLLERILARLERAGIDISGLRARFATEGENLALLKADVLSLWASLDVDTQAGSSLSLSDKASINKTITNLMAQLKALGIDVSGYEVYLTNESADLLSIEKELAILLKTNGVDTSIGSTMTVAQTQEAVSALTTMINQLKLLGIDVTAYQAALNTGYPDYLALENQLKTVLAANGVDTKTGSTMTAVQEEKAITALTAMINQLKLLGVNVTTYQNALNSSNPDYLALETKLKTALASNGVDTTTGSTSSLGSKDDDDEDEIEEREEEDEHEEDREHEEEDDD